MNANHVLDNVLRLVQFIDNCEADCPEECLELTDLVGKLSVMIGKGVLPDRWRQADPCKAAVLRYDGKLAVMDETQGFACRSIRRAGAREGVDMARNLARRIGITPREAAAVIFAATLDGIAESEG